MIRLLTFLLLVSYSSVKVNATVTIKGTVTDESDQPLPFCNIYIPNTSYACISNETGNFVLQVEPGKYTITFQFIGFKKQNIPVHAVTEAITLTIKMEPEVLELQEVVINSDKEDPAYAIIRKAIEYRQDNLQSVRSFSCDAYIKGLQKLIEAPDKVLGIQLNTIVDVDSNNSGIVYLSESSSTFHYQYPDKSKEIMHASIVSGDDQQFSWNDAASMQMNFYNNLETLEGFSQRGFVSPIADNALFFYTYSLIGQTYENNHIIYKIAVAPKRKSDPAYTGTIYITDHEYRFTALQLELTSLNGIEFIDTFTVSQEFFYTDPDHLVLRSNQFNFNYNFFGIKGMGYFHASYNNYTLNAIYPKNFFNGEVIKIEANANKKDDTYWSNIRPIQLTTEEQKDYIAKDSLAIIKETTAYKDSMDRIFNKLDAADIITGYTWRDSDKKIVASSNPLPDMLHFNTVEGYVVNPKIRLTKWFENKNEINFYPGVRYGFNSDTWYANAGLSYKFDPLHLANIAISGGTGVQQFNTQGISPLVNSLYSLLLEENYLKLYEQQYFNIKGGRELTNGFYVEGQMHYTQRSQLFNLATPDIWYDRENNGYSSNNFPFYTDSLQFKIPTKSSVKISGRYAFGQTYIMLPDEKNIINSKYPTINFSWEKAIPGVFGSSVNYDILRFGVEDKIKLALAGNIMINTEVGKMFAHYNLNEADLVHFLANETIIERIADEAYFLLPYYLASTDNSFVSGHFQWHTEGFLFRQLPLFKQLKMEPVFSSNYLYTENIGHYVELAAGVEHLFKIIRIDAAFTPYQFTNYPSEKFKLLIGFGF